MHDQVKDLFRLFVDPNSTKIVSKGRANESTKVTNGDGGGEYHKRSYTKAQIIGLILGPAPIHFNFTFPKSRRTFHRSKGRTS